MKIKVLGTRAKIEVSAENYKNHSGYLIDDKILLDVGEYQFLEENLQAILFTHFHPDHAFFVFEDAIFQPKIPHFGPEKNPLLPKMEVVFKKFKIGAYTITPFPVIHALKLKSLGYLIEKDDERVFFTGDVAWIEKAELKKLPKVDLIVTEATFIQKGGRINRKGNKIFGHTGIPDLIRILKPHTQKIVFSHFGYWFYEDVQKGIQQLKDLEPEGVELIPAFDSFEIEI